MKSIFEGLNSAQEAAVRGIDGPSLIIAGAGSGKTRVLTCKIANIIENGAAPREILALTLWARPGQGGSGWALFTPYLQGF